jgi:hypothetical protein
LAEREIDGGSTVQASTAELLPEEEVAVRRVLVEHVAVPTLIPGSPAMRPATVTVRPPYPFAGTGVYHRASKSMIGRLSVHFPGRTVRIGGKRSKANLLVAR